MTSWQATPNERSHRICFFADLLRRTGGRFFLNGLFGIVKKYSFKYIMYIYIYIYIPNELILVYFFVQLLIYIRSAARRPGACEGTERLHQMASLVVASGCVKQTRFCVPRV